MTPIEVLKMLKSKIDEAEFYKSNYVLQTNDVEAINQALRIHDVVGRSEQLSCETCIFNTHSWSEDYPCATCCGFDKHQAT